jgi:hypothetical protein
MSGCEPTVDTDCGSDAVYVTSMSSCLCNTSGWTYHAATKTCSDSTVCDPTTCASTEYMTEACVCTELTNPADPEDTVTMSPETFACGFNADAECNNGVYRFDLQYGRAYGFIDLIGDSVEAVNM